MSEIFTSTPSEAFWGLLMSSLERGEVVPCIGQDMLEVDVGDGMMPLNRVVAPRALALIGLEGACGPTPTLHEAAVCCLSRTDGAEVLRQFYWAVDNVVSQADFPIPPALNSLAGIEAFRLYVTTAFDPLLARAINEARFGGAPRTRSYAYALLKRPEDLPAPIDELKDPVVYHLFGRSAAFSTSDYALTEEDTLEFMQALRSNADAPRNLFAELRTLSPLIIGSGYSDWLTRFFLRATRGKRLRDAGPPSGWIADALGGDPSLVRFLQHFSGQTYRVVPGDPREFVKELAQRWTTHGTARKSAARPADEPPAIDPQSIFVSYAREDAVAVGRLVAKLREARLPAWLDTNVFRGGEEFDRDITAEISRCALFIPVVSRQVLTYGRRYVFSEWKAAIKLSNQFPRTFLVPCVVDDVPRNAEQIPQEIRDILHIQDIRDDAGLDAFVAHVRQLYRKFQLAESSP